MQNSMLEDCVSTKILQNAGFAPNGSGEDVTESGVNIEISLNVTIVDAMKVVPEEQPRNITRQWFWGDFISTDTKI